MDHEQVEEAVAIVVEKGGAGAPAGAGDPCTRGDVGEMAVAVSFQQYVRAEIGDVQIDVAVVVEIACCDPHSVIADIGAAAGRDVLEHSAATVAKQVIARRPAVRHAHGRPAQRRGTAGGRRKTAALHHVHIQEPVVVHVEQSGTAAHDLRKIELVAMAGLVNEANA